MIYDHEQIFDTAKNFIDFFQNHSDFQTNNIWETNILGRGGFIYRGQSEAYWQLKPSVFRTYDALVNYTPQTPGNYNYTNKRQWLGLHLHAELRAVFIFLQTADKLGIETPIDYSRLSDHYELINKALNNHDYNYSENFPKDKTLEELALVQHHGVPTRLLDWTESPLIACFFAALGASSTKPEIEQIKSEYISVSCFNTYYFSKSDEILKVEAPRHRNNFLCNQQGVFTHMPRANAYLLEHDKWPSIEDVVGKNKILNGALRKYCLPSTEANNLLRILYDYGISPHQMMPTFDNIAKSYAYVSKLFDK